MTLMHGDEKGSAFHWLPARMLKYDGWITQRLTVTEREQIYDTTVKVLDSSL